MQAKLTSIALTVLVLLNAAILLVRHPGLTRLVQFEIVGACLGVVLTLVLTLQRRFPLKGIVYASVSMLFMLQAVAQVVSK